MFNPIRRTVLTRTLFFVFTDAILIALSVWLAFLIRFDGQIPQQYSYFISRMIIFALIFTLPIFYFSKLYSFSWSYVSASEAVSLFKATVISFLFLGLTIYISRYFPRFENFPRSTIFVSYFLIFLFCGATRFSKRIYLDIVGKNRASEKEKTLIVGAGDAGEQILRSIISSKNNNYSPVGFVDDNPIKRDVVIHGFRVLGRISDIPKLAGKYGVKQLVVALPTAGPSVIRRAVELGKAVKIKKIKIIPNLREIIGGEVSLRSLKDVDVYDLLGRDPVGIELKQIESFIKGKAILVTGAAGSIGSELCRQTARFKPAELLLLDQDETGIFNILNELKSKFYDLKIRPFIADIRDEEKINTIFQRFGPKIVFHAAAYKHVPLMEEDPDEAVKNNIFGTENLVKASVAGKAEKFIFISTDKAVNPVSVMGMTKRIGEMICQIYNQKNSVKFVSVRFGNVLDSRGSVIPLFREQIKRGGPVEVTDPEMKRYFMLISEACLLVMQAGAMGQGGEVFVLDMGKPVKILDLAKEMIKLSGLKPDKDIAIVFTGMRPGEKLFEEILTAEEGVVATKNQKIFMAKISGINVNALNQAVESLNSLKSAKDSRKILEILSSTVSDYRSGIYESAVLR